MEIQRDFKELLESLNARDVAYVVVGAHALAFHGAPRYTGDLDILLRADRENASKLLNALEDFGFGAVGLTIEDFSVPDRMVQLGMPPVRIDLLTSLTGVSWEETLSGCCESSYGEVPIRYLGKQELIRNKRALGRAKDLADIEALEQ
jgi:hypothetical protein